MTVLAAAATALGIAAAPASAARVPIPHIGGSDVRLLLRNADTFTVTPPDGVPPSRITTALDDARADLRARLDAGVEQAPTDQRAYAIRARVRGCADEAFQGAGQDTVTAVATGEDPDFNGFMLARATECMTAAFPEAPPESIAFAAEIITANADRVAEVAFDETASSTDPDPADTYDPGVAADTPIESDDGGGGSSLPVGGAILVTALLGIGVLFFRRKKAG